MRPVDRHNFLAITGDFVFFGVGLAFASQTTVLPSFVATLTSSTLLIGLVSTLANGGWLLPQLFAANATAGLPRRKPAIVVPAIANRILFLAIGPLMWVLVPRSPRAAVAVFLALFGAFYVLDGIASVSWLDMLAKLTRPQLRARLISVGQAGSGLAGVAAGVLVGLILASRRLPYPANYVLLISLGAVMFTISLGLISLIREEPEHTGERPLPWPDFFRRLGRILRDDADYVRAVIVQVLFTLSGAAAPFYVIHGLESLAFPESSVGVFTSAQVAGGVVSALFMGYVGEKRGTRAVMRLWGAMAAATPILALALSLSRAAMPAPVLMYAYAMVFVVVGAQSNSLMAGFLNYVLEYAPSSARTIYIGFANTASAIQLVAPLVGGAILALTGSYPVLFVAASLGPLAGLLLSLRMVEPRRR
jgi:MFS family permease